MNFCALPEREKAAVNQPMRPGWPGLGASSGSLLPWERAATTAGKTGASTATSMAGRRIQTGLSLLGNTSISVASFIPDAPLAVWGPALAVAQFLTDL